MSQPIPVQANFGGQLQVHVDSSLPGRYGLDLYELHLAGCQYHLNRPFSDSHMGFRCFIFFSGSDP